MAGALHGIDVIDLSWGIAGPMTGMLLADQGAAVTKVDPPGGDPFAGFSGYRVWNRRKAPLVVDLRDRRQHDELLARIDAADVVIETYAPGTAARLGVDHETLCARNPRLVHCTITGYGESGRHADRPAYDALVAARTGAQWDVRGRVGGTIGLLAGTGGMLPGLDPPPGCLVGAERDGPLFTGVPWPSVAAFYLATLGITAALRAREHTGRGQHVHTSLLQGVLATTIASWQRVERPDHPGFETWVIDPRAPKGFFRAADGRWTHHWVPLPAFVLGASQGGRLAVTEEVTAPKDAPLRIGMSGEDMVVLHHYHPLMAEAVARFTSQEWADFAAGVGVPVQVVRSPEEALNDPLLLDDGCVVEVEDPDVGRVRHVGRVLSLSACDAGTRSSDASPPPPPHTVRSTALAHPLEGVVVLDLGLAVAGPFGTQLLSDLGADVIKVNNQIDRWWMANHIAMCCNRGKRSITIDLKNPAGLAILHRLVERADVVHHNMRYDAARRLGVDYDALRGHNPSLIYCHTRGHERGPRDALPANDQTGAALAGTEWLDGGLDDGGTPIWPLTSLGDTGNGFLSAIGVIEALYHRDRTGEGQFVDTSILYAHLLNASMAWAGDRPSGRPTLDGQQLGWGPRYRLYRAADVDDRGWVCVAAVTDAHAAALAQVTGCAPDDAAALERAFASRPAREWVKLLDDAGVPCEISDPDFVRGVFDDPELVARGWVTSYDHPHVGRMEVAGLLVDLADTPGRIAGPPLVPGQDTRAILAELDIAEDEVERLIADGAVEAVDLDR